MISCPAPFHEEERWWGVGNNFTSAVLQRVALNFVLAGRDTSSVALSCFFWLVMNHQEMEQRIVDEISTVLRNTRGPDPKKWLQEPLMFDEADKLIYLKADTAFRFHRTSSMWPKMMAHLSPMDQP
ncbi:hypothetical protein V6N13_019632 [Hibiscus sabdariffa]|uniref:Cytochrome P450 n=1 Tax=Hibiscus sabdariffa TaxID=183260 RepID=A0ABR2ENV0_9ROSI